MRATEWRARPYGRPPRLRIRLNKLETHTTSSALRFDLSEVEISVAEHPEGTHPRRCNDKQGRPYVYPPSEDWSMNLEASHVSSFDDSAIASVRMAASASISPSSMISGGESAIVSPVTRTSAPLANARVNTS